MNTILRQTFGFIESNTNCIILFVLIFFIQLVSTLEYIVFSFNRQFRLKLNLCCKMHNPECHFRYHTWFERFVVFRMDLDYGYMSSQMKIHLSICIVLQTVILDRCNVLSYIN
jgi:hypothetical protein